MNALAYMGLGILIYCALCAVVLGGLHLIDRNQAKRRTK